MNEDPKERKKKGKLFRLVSTRKHKYIYSLARKKRRRKFTRNLNVHLLRPTYPSLAGRDATRCCIAKLRAIVHIQISPRASFSISLYLFYRKLFASIAHTHTSLALRLHFLEASRAPPSTHPRILPASLSLYHPGVRHFSVIAPRAIKRAACVYLAGGGFNDMHCPPARAHENISAREN